MEWKESGIGVSRGHKEPFKSKQKGDDIMSNILFTEEQTIEIKSLMGERLAKVYIEWCTEHLEEIANKWFGIGGYKNAQEALADEAFTYTMAMEFNKWLLENYEIKTEE